MPPRLLQRPFSCCAVTGLAALAGLPACGWHAADLEQLKSECLDLGQYAVQRGLIGGASQQRALTLSFGVQGAALV